MKNRIALHLGVLALAVSLARAPAHAQCLDWATGFESSGPSGGVHALLTISSGPLQGMYAAGEFDTSAGVTTSNIARWNGTAWSALGAGISAGRLPRVSALAFFNGELIAGGSFALAGGAPASNVARWNGTGWSPLGAGVDDAVYALAVFDDGSGPALYAGGSFAKAGGSTAAYLARWNGTAWSAVAGAPEGPVTSLTSAPSAFPGGAALFVGGNFDNAGALSAHNVARWNGTTWSTLGVGTNDTVHALVVHDDGSGGGSSLFVGGGFSSAGGNTGDPVARWNGAAWSTVGPVSATDTAFDNVRAFMVHGGVLYAGGRFKSAGGVSASSIARWTGSAWVSVSGGMNGTVRALAVFDGGVGDPCGPSLYAAGHFSTAGGGVRSHVAKLCGASWTPVGSGGGMSDGVDALLAFDGQLYAGGAFRTAGSAAASHIARWNGTSWSALGSGLDGRVHALCAFDDGSGPALYAAGDFKTSGATNVNCIAKWNGASFSPLGFGLTGPVHALCVYDDGSGPALYAAGEFTAVAAVAVLPDGPVTPAGPSPHISRWNGSAWSGVGSGTNGVVRALTVQGGALIAGGEFTGAGALRASHVARWQGGAWSALGKGFDAPVNTLIAWSGNLIAGGEFRASGVVPAAHLASWNGVVWSQLGQGFDGDVRALALFDDGSGGGTRLFAGGDFEHVGALPAARIARFEGASFTPLLAGLSDSVQSLAAYDSGSGSDLYVGGEFTRSGIKPASRLARWVGCP